LGRVEQTLVSCAQIDQTLTGLRDTVSRASSTLADVSSDLRRYGEKLSADPERLEAIQDRLHFLKELKRKYGGSIESCLEKLNLLKAEIDQVLRYDELLDEKEKLLEEMKGMRATLAADLSKKRRIIADELSKLIEKELSGLNLGRTRFAVRIEHMPEEQWGAEGKDNIEFLISPNVGEELRPLVKIASGGELSRFMLAIKRVLADKTELMQTSIYDEVDNGIGGATAEIVGRKLREVAKSRQVICITHLPQIACFGENHFRVLKKIVKGRTQAEMELLDDHERVLELSRMLGGTKITEAARAHAEEMLERAKPEKIDLKNSKHEILNSKQIQNPKFK
jgi:DNA repair protein RecN (Recombination protein N)